MFIARFAGITGVKFGSSNRAEDGPDSPEIFWPVRRYLLSCNPEPDTFTDAASINECMEVLENFAGTAALPGYNPCLFVDFSDKDQILRKTVNCYKEMSAAAILDGKSSDISAPNALCIQSSFPAEPPELVLAKFDGQTPLRQ